MACRSPSREGGGDGPRARHALLIVRELVLGPKRFTDLRAGLANVGPDMLAARLRELEATGVVRRRRLGPAASAHVYELTEWGRELDPVLVALGRWGSRAPLAAEPPALGVDALAVALQTMFEPDRAMTTSRTFELWLGEQVFSLIIDRGQLDLRRGEAAGADVVSAPIPGRWPQCCGTAARRRARSPTVTCSWTGIVAPPTSS